jgi:hypothetical protein
MFVGRGALGRQSLMRRWGRLAVEVSVALMLTGWGWGAAAADVVVGSVVAVRGAVFSDAGAGQQPLTVNAPVHRGETIVTVAGKAKIALKDGTILSIGENSRMLVHHSASGASANIAVGLVSGVLRPLVVRATTTGRFEVETQTAIAAVRGTDWVIEATPERTSVAVLQGVVAVSGRTDRKATVVLRSPGQGTDVHRGSAPTPAVPWGTKRLADVLARATFD